MQRPIRAKVGRERSLSFSWHHPCSIRTEFDLDALGSGGDVIRAIRALTYKKGNTRTGAALLHVSDHIFRTQLSRPGIPKVIPSPALPPLVIAK